MRSVTTGNNDHEFRTPKIAFLVYYSRSGSTFLSSRLAQYPDVDVTIESDLIRTLLLRKKDILQAGNSDEVYRLITDGSRVSSFNVSCEEFRGRLRTTENYTIYEVTRAILEAYCEKKKVDSKIWLIKDGANGYWINQLAKEFPEAKFIHIIRDGRAVYNSGSQAVQPYGKNERMARDPLTAARTWTQLVDHIDLYTFAHPAQCIECRYEDVVTSESYEMDRIRHFLGLEQESATGDYSEYYEGLPDIEKAIHSRVRGAADSDRIEAWRTELGRGERLAFEYRASRTLKRHGYQVDSISLFHLLMDVHFIIAVAASVMLRFRGWFSLVRNPTKLRRVLESKALYRRDVNRQ